MCLITNSCRNWYRIHNYGVSILAACGWVPLPTPFSGIDPNSTWEICMCPQVCTSANGRVVSMGFLFLGHNRLWIGIRCISESTNLILVSTAERVHVHN